MSENEKNAFEFIVNELKGIRKELNDLNNKLDKNEKEVCALCGEPFEEDEEKIMDDSNSYGGYCHESCFEEAEESRF